MVIDFDALDEVPSYRHSSFKRAAGNVKEKGKFDWKRGRECGLPFVRGYSSRLLSMVGAGYRSDAEAGAKCRSTATTSFVWAVNALN